MRTGKGTALSAALGKSDSWARKVLDGESGVMLGDIPRLLSELGLKVVGQDRVCVPRDEFLAYRTLAERYVATPRSLEWDES